MAWPSPCLSADLGSFDCRQPKANPRDFVVRIFKFGLYSVALVSGNGRDRRWRGRGTSVSRADKALQDKQLA